VTPFPLDETHDPGLPSWVEAANAPDTDFPLTNLPFGCFRHRTAERPRVGVAIGDRILDLSACVREGLLSGLDPAVRGAVQSYALNALMGLGPTDWTRVRRAVHALLRADSAAAESARAKAREVLVAMADTAMTLPAEIGDYTDFYASVHHATNVGSMFRPDQPLLPNYKWVPIGYHGRASSIVVSGTPVRRPTGQRRPDPAVDPVVGPTASLDYELEVGAFVGAGNPLGEPIPIAAAHDQLFGLCLLNDWSARDVQSWEYQPLGPFLAKNFATTISPWVVTRDALAPFRVAPAPRPAGDPSPLAYLDDPVDRAHGAFTVALEVAIVTPAMRARGDTPFVVSRGSFTEMYWTVAQLLTHHASAGCNLRPGDLLGSGTVSGPTPESRGCLLERTWRGTEPLALPQGETRRFLEDGDEVILRGWCARDGMRRIGFGECRGTVQPAR
jgi:fumarylacetoacetase